MYRPGIGNLFNNVGHILFRLFIKGHVNKNVSRRYNKYSTDNFVAVTFDIIFEIKIVLIKPKELNDIEDYIFIRLLPIFVRAIKIASDPFTTVSSFRCSGFGSCHPNASIFNSYGSVPLAVPNVPNHLPSMVYL